MTPTRTVTNHTVKITLPARPRPLSDIEILDLPRPSSDLGHHLDEAPEPPSTPSEVSTTASLSPPLNTSNPFVSTATLNHSASSLPSIAITPSKDDDGVPVSSAERGHAASATSSFYDTEVERATVTAVPEGHRRQLRPLEKVLIGFGAVGFVAGIVLAALYARKSL